MRGVCSSLSKQAWFRLLLLSCAAALLWSLTSGPRSLPSLKKESSRPLRSPVILQFKAKRNRARGNHNDSDLLRTLQRKLSEFPDEKTSFPSQSCNALTKAAACIESSCPAKLSTQPADRLAEILRTRNDSIGHYLAAMDRAVTGVRDHKYIFATASSTHFYGKLPGLIHNLKKRLFPWVDNFVFLVFDLGLTARQRKHIQEICGCLVLDFPFSALPGFVKKLKCYAWKPLIIQALLPKSEFLVWMDTSVVWNADVNVTSVFQRLEERGLMLGAGLSGTIAQRTLDSTFHYFGDQSCQYEPYHELHAGYDFFHNEPFVREAVVRPWVTCALTWKCVCIPNHASKLPCNHQLPRKRSVCHRFDQSALGIIVSKLYQERRGLVTLPQGVIKIVR